MAAFQPRSFILLFSLLLSHCAQRSQHHLYVRFWSQSTKKGSFLSGNIERNPPSPISVTILALFLIKVIIRLSQVFTNRREPVPRLLRVPEVPNLSNRHGTCGPAFSCWPSSMQGGQAKSVLPSPATPSPARSPWPSPPLRAVQAGVTRSSPRQDNAHRGRDCGG